LVQVIPDFTARVNSHRDSISWQISGVITTISGKDSLNHLTYAFGFGLNISLKLKLRKKNNLYFSIATGNAMAHFINIFKGKGEDAVLNTETNKFEGNFATAGYVAYQKYFPHDLSGSVSVGLGALSNQAFKLGNDFNYAYNILFDVFWTPIPGARVGLEYAYGKRIDIDHEKGRAGRISILIYYDF
jgi:hypothetical protein